MEAKQNKIEVSLSSILGYTLYKMPSAISYDKHMSALSDAWSVANTLISNEMKTVFNNSSAGHNKKTYCVIIQKGKIKNICNVDDKSKYIAALVDKNFILTDSICVEDWRNRMCTISTIDHAAVRSLKNWLKNNNGPYGVGGIEFFLMRIMLNPELAARHPRFYATAQRKYREFKTEIRKRNYLPSIIINDFREFLTLIKKRRDYVAPSSEHPVHYYKLRPRKSVVYYPQNN